MDLKRANSASTVMPTSLNGRASNQTMGNKTKANKANGQHNTNKTIQIRNVSPRFITAGVCLMIRCVSNHPPANRRTLHGCACN